MEKVIRSYTVNPGHIAGILRSRWYWILGSTCTTLLMAWLYLWYTPPLFGTSATIRIEENQNELSSLTGIISPKGYINRIQSESMIFKSLPLLQSAVDHIDWRISYFHKTATRDVELYPEKPFTVYIVRQDPVYFNKMIDMEDLGPEQYLLRYKKDNIIYRRRFRWGSRARVPGIIFRIDRPLPKWRLQPFRFRFTCKEEWCDRILRGLTITEAAKFSPVAILSKTDLNPVFAADALNALIHEYLENDLRQKTQSASRIIDFIDKQLVLLSSKVDSSGRELAKFRQHTYSDDPEVRNDKISEHLVTIQLRIETLSFQLETLRNAENLLESGGSTMNLQLLGHSALNMLTSQLSTLVSRQDQLSIPFGEKSPALILIRQQISDTRRDIWEILRSIKRQLNQEVSFYTRKLKAEETKLMQLPVQARELELRNRDYSVNQKFLNFLSEKRLEAQIGKASILPGAILIDPAVPHHEILSPLSVPVWRSAVILGMLTGAGAIFLVRAFSSYIYDCATITQHSNIPVIGVIRHLEYSHRSLKIRVPAADLPGTAFSESVKSVRSSLHYLDKDTGAKIFCITSAGPGEGKTFIAANLAATFTLLNKKVLLIAADLRKSDLHKIFLLENTDGLSEYLTGKADWEHIIQPTDYKGLDLITSGYFPENPAELFYASRFQELLIHARSSYDIILFDTSPAGLVSDPIEILRHSDKILFILRAGVSKIAAAQLPQYLQARYDTQPSVIVLNAWNGDPLHAGRYPAAEAGPPVHSGYPADRYYYGYTTAKDKRPWWKFMSK